MSNDIHAQIMAMREDLKSDMEAYGKNIAKHMAQDIAMDLTEYSEQVMSDFYADYNPKSYSRHGNFYNISRRYYKKRGDLYIGGVDLLRNELPDVYSGSYSEPFYVFNRVVFEGLHGFASLTIPNTITNTPPNFSPPPYARVLKKRDEILNNIDQYETAAANKAKKDNYVYLFK